MQQPETGVFMYFGSIRDKKLFESEEKYRKNQSFQSCLLLDFSQTNPPTLLYPISIQKILTILDDP